MQFRAGDRINHYTLLEPLGEGGQGSVWKVIDPRDGGVVRALKLVSLVGAKPAVFERVVREARILASATHPALVTCHSFFEETRDGVVGLLMDLVPGRSLEDAVATRGLDRGQSLALLAQVAEALAYLHGQGLVHRDLKPANLMLTEGFWESPTRHGAVKLVDFGIAASAGNAVSLTTPGTVIGTLRYLAPELVDPASWGKAGGPPRDIFALGVLAYQLLMNRHPTGLGEDAAMIDFARAYKAAEAGRIAWPPPGLDGSWGVTVSACLALRPADRPANGAAVLEMLRTGAAVRSEPRPGASRPTSLHSAPSFEAPTAYMQPPVSVRTEPMGAPPPYAPPPYAPPPYSARTIEAAPMRESLTGSPVPPPSRKLWVALLVLLGAIGGAVAFALLRGSSAEVPPIPLPVEIPVPTLTASPPETAINPCRREGLEFKPRATRFECPVCTGNPGPVPPGHWQMRFSGVTSPTLRLTPTTKICAQVTGGPPVCAPFSMLPDFTGAAGRLPVTTSDIDGGSVYFSIREGATILARGFGRRRPGTTRYLETALCSGFVLLLDDPAVPSTTI
ncbi:MAG: protein kinase domain-containing protein, partial [Byssovorax sp.]